MQPPRTAAALVIGNELLTGKIQDRNIPVLAQELFALGVELRRVVICRDLVDVIAEDLDALRHRHDFVFTSGGVGPTHDDVTMRAVARAFGAEIVRHEELAALLAGYFGDRLTEEHLRMADMPEGAELVQAPDVRWPTVKMGNVFVLPGLPEIFRHKMPTVRAHLGADAPFLTRTVNTASDEGAIALLLEDVERRYPQVQIGSYPKWGDGPVRVAVTFDGRDVELVESAATAFAEGLPGDELVSSDVASLGAVVLETAAETAVEERTEPAPVEPAS